MGFILKICIWAGLLYAGHRFLKKDFRRPQINHVLLLWGLVLLYVFVFFYLNWSRHASLNTSAIDLSVYLQSLSNFRLYSLVLGKSLLAGHFSPWLYMLVPVVKLWTTPGLLFFIQAAVLAGAAIPLYRIGRRLGLDNWLALVLAFVYLNFVYTREMAFSDFHVENFMPLGFLLLFEFYLARARLAFWLTLAACLTIKEDVGFYLFPWAVLAGWLDRDNRKTAWLSGAASLVAGIVSLIVLLPGHGGTYPYFQNWAAYGKGLFGIAVGAVRQPFATLGVLLKPELMHVLLSMAFLPLLTFWGVALLAPAWLQLASSHPAQAGLHWYYAAPVLPFLFAALAAGWAKVDARAKLSPLYATITLGIALFLIIFNFTWIAPPKVTAEHRAAARLLGSLPEKASVLAQANTAPHIPRPARVRVLGLNAMSSSPSLVVFHVKGNIWPFTREKYLRALDRLRLDPNYTVLKEESGLVIFRRKPEEQK